MKSPFKMFLASRFASDNKGVAAVEFAIIAPILLLLFVMTMEISFLVSVDRKISRVSSSVADLITQNEEFTRAELDELMEISTRIMSPYEDSANALTIAVTAITIDSGGKATVAWSHGYQGADLLAPGAVVDVPTNIRIPDTHLLSAVVNVDHAPAVTFLGFSADKGLEQWEETSIPLEEQMFLRPRVGNDGIRCTDCPTS